MSSFQDLQSRTLCQASKPMTQMLHAPGSCSAMAADINKCGI
jgi:hypothetical protein